MSKSLILMEGLMQFMVEVNRFLLFIPIWV